MIVAVSRTFRIAVPPNDDAPPLTFPSRCVGCGGPHETESTLLVARQVMRERGRRAKPQQKTVTFKYAVPHCARCARATKAVFLAALIPCLLGLLVVGGAVFVVVTVGAWRLGLDEGGRPEHQPSLVLGAFAGLVAGIAGGFVFEVVGRLLLLPFFGRSLWRAPLLAPQFITDADYVAGLTATPSRDARELRLTFSRDEAAADFAALNRNSALL